jgi:LuxR family maltose regulon positive regulatory protein
VDLARPEKIRRPFLLLDSRLRSTIQRYRLLNGEHTGFIDTIPGKEPTYEPADGEHGPVENLTEREQTVLEFLPTMLKASEIAADLDVSINTVKAHLRSLYRKLEVGTRREAVERARARGLL